MYKRYIDVRRCGMLVIFLILFTQQVAGTDAVSTSSSLAASNMQMLQNEIWKEDWLGGWGYWYADAGVWQVGVPTSGPGSAYSDTMCAATILSGNYPSGANSRLISPPVALPAFPADDKLTLRFWHWFNFSSSDYGYVEYSVSNGPWERLSIDFRYYGARWTKHNISLPDSAFGQSVRFAFHIRDISGIGHYESSGWYLDDLSVLEGECDPWVPEGFEGNTDCWYSEKGVWEIGSPTSGPNSSNSGHNCAATVLSGNYPGSADSRLISPSVTLTDSPQDETLWFRFWHWFNFYSSDRGYVEYSVEGGPWQTISDTFYYYGARWTQYMVSLPDSSFGRSVRFAFHIVDAAGIGHYENSGWYIDDIDLVEGIFSWNEPESFTDKATMATPSIGGWYADRGVWEVGSPSVGPGGSYLSAHCAGTVLSGDYPASANSRLISPSTVLNPSPDDGVLWLSIWHWFNFRDSSDRGYIEYSVEGGPWQTISDTFYYYGKRWTKYMVSLPDSSFGHSVRFAFHIVDAAGIGHYTGTGWYIDYIELIEGSFSALEPVTFDEKYYVPEKGGWYADRGVWEIGEPSYGTTGGFNSDFCAGTDMSGAYPSSANSRLVSPTYTLPSSLLDGKLWLHFWHWFNFYSSDRGYVEISVNEGPWAPISDEFRMFSGVWTNHIIDLGLYAGQDVRFAFKMIDAAGIGHYEAPGWLIDNVSIVESPKTFNNIEYFNEGVRGWYATQGVWEIGEPGAGPGSAYSGSGCAGTVLNGNYPSSGNSGLMSPVVQLPASPPGGMLMVRFQHWYSFSGSSDNGILQASFSGGAWETIAGPFTGVSGSWTPYIVDIISHAGEEAQFRFWFYDAAGIGHYTSTGWYIDDFEIIGGDTDNPAEPVLHSVDYSTGPPLLTWDNPAGDFDYISIYTGRDPEFMPDLGHRIATVSGTTFEDTDRPGWGTYYKISAIKQYSGAWHESAPVGPGTITDVEEPEDYTPAVTQLRQNFPNPFNPVTSISFDLSKRGHVNLSVYDVAGRKVAQLLNEDMGTGRHDVQFNAHGLASGIYFYRLHTPEIVQTKKMVLLR